MAGAVKGTKGAWGEECAAAYLRRRGYRILARNYSCRFGEIDITTAKQARIRTAASLWLAEHETQLQPRFDVIEIYGDADTPHRQRRINQIENAFE